MNTSVKQKKELWPKFEAACKSQWMGGGHRYALSPDKEFTDLICETIGNNFCAGQILKQTGELTNINPKTEVSFFKIAVWAFIWWLKEQENLTDRDKGEEFDAGTQPPLIGPDIRGKINVSPQSLKAERKIQRPGSSEER